MARASLMCCILLTACVESGARRCDLALADERADCACEGGCPSGQVCRAGACCNPAEHASDPANCGCSGPVGPGGLCLGGVSCVPGDHLGDAANCGCAGPCAQGQRCVGGQCLCHPAAHQSDPLDCGCQGPCQQSAEVCHHGQCVCDPSQNLGNANHCACTGPCAEGKTCSAGRCVCPAGFVDCAGDCQPIGSEACGCAPGEHLSDASNCGCTGPCGPGEKCAAGLCACDPDQHAADAGNCGCTGQKCTGGQVCHDGGCACPSGQVWCTTPSQPPQCQSVPCCDPAAHQSDASNCGCGGPCPNGIACALGSCSMCDPLANSANSAQCGCQGACQLGAYCVAGQCVCQPGLLPCLAKVGVFKDKPTCKPSVTAEVCADCQTICLAGQLCALKPGLEWADYAKFGPTLFRCCPATGCAD